MPLALASIAAACGPSGVDPFVRLDAPVVALAHVRVIDGTGRAGTDDQTVVIQDGQRADAVVVRGNPSTCIADVRNVEMVFKNGLAYDPAALIEATNGTVSRYDFGRLLRWPWNAIIGTLAALLIARIAWRVLHA